MENFCVIFKSRPGVNGEPKEDNFKYVRCDYPLEELRKGEVLVKTLYLSIDPAMRCRMNEDTGANYISPWELGKAADGMGVGVVVSSNDAKFKVGDIVVATNVSWPWQLYFTTSTENITHVNTQVTGPRISLALGYLGVTGLTSLLGIRVKGCITRGANETFVVSGAAGACGIIAGQIARLEGCGKVIGICGSDEKCRILKNEVGFNEAINYKVGNLKEKLTAAACNGIDVYFDNVGGDISDAVIELMNINGRVILCGQISQYNKDVPYPPPLLKRIEEILEEKKIQRYDNFNTVSEDQPERGVKKGVTSRQI